MKAVFVTGSNGGVGTAICKHLKQNNYFVIGSDINVDVNNLDGFLKVDLSDISKDNEFYKQFSINLKDIIGGNQLVALVNNAAVQIISSIESLNIEDFKHTLDVNLVAPMALSKILYPYLKTNKGSIVNIGSIHAKLTKPGFISYATSKAALVGLTQALSVDCGKYIRVNAIQPAATGTEMLLDGFKSSPDALIELSSYHPTNTIASPHEIAEALFFLISDQCPFINGSILDVNGGIGSRLHDPL